jgi:hypothetical protein
VILGLLFRQSSASLFVILGLEPRIHAQAGGWGNSRQFSPHAIALPQGSGYFIHHRLQRCSFDISHLYKSNPVG